MIRRSPWLWLSKRHADLFPVARESERRHDEPGCRKEQRDREYSTMVLSGFGHCARAPQDIEQRRSQSDVIPSDQPPEEQNQQSKREANDDDDPQQFGSGERGRQDDQRKSREDERPDQPGDAKQQVCPIRRDDDG